MVTDFLSVPFLEPPRPKRTLRQLRRSDKNAWRLLQALIRQWIDEVLPEPIPGNFGAELLPGLCPVLDGDIAGEAKLECIEKLFDAGVLRLRMERPAGVERFPYWLEVWTGQGYRMVGRGKRP